MSARTRLLISKLLRKAVEGAAFVLGFMKVKSRMMTAFSLAAIILISFPVRDLVADHYYRRVAVLLNDKTTEGIDVAPISEQTMPAYLAAIASLERAAFISPSKALYQKALADIYQRLGKWAQTMQSLGASLPEGFMTGQDAARKELFHLRRAVALEPTNPDYHLALGKLWDRAGGDPVVAAAEIKKAVAAYPINAPLRHAVALHYLLGGKNGDAIEHARVLAKIDDTYIIDKAEYKIDMIERQTPGYIAMLTGSYLYSALEIAWRASRDPEVVKGIAPDTPEAAPVLQLFLATRKIN